MKFRNDMSLEELNEARVGIYGYGSTGESLVEILRPVAEQLVIYEDNPSNITSIADSSEEDVTVVENPSILRRELDLMLSSPGIPGDHAMLRQARESGIPVWGEIELAYRIADGGTFWAVTGTNGKSTCSELAGHLLERKYGADRVAVCGNRGSPLIENVIDMPREAHYVVEVSSFQVEGLDGFQPDGTLLTNISDDHLDYHDSRYEYHGLKYELLRKTSQGGPLVLPQQRANRRWLQDRAAVRTFNRFEVNELPLEFSGERRIRFKNKVVDLKNVETELMLFPENIISVTALLFDEITVDQLRNGLETFQGLKFRAQEVDTSNGRRVINDSKGTNPSAVRELLERIEGDVRLVLGGGAKNADYGNLIETIRQRNTDSITIAGTGSTADRVERICSQEGLDYERLTDWEDAVKSTYARAGEGETVLLSPGGTSFDNFEDYRDRGKAFEQWIRESSHE